jgi:hypothetical protein
MAWLYRVPIERVFIQPDGHGFISHQRNLLAADCEQWAVCVLAGIEAELLAYHTAPIEGDLTVLADAEARFGLKLCIQDLRTTAGLLIKQNWRKVLAVAEALLRWYDVTGDGSLTGDDINILLESFQNEIRNTSSCAGSPAPL